MKTILILLTFMMLLMGLIVFKNPFYIIESNSKIIEKFENCKEGSIYAPTNYNIISTGILIIELLNNIQYSKLISNQTYSSIYYYSLNPSIYYDINLSYKYNKINGTCYIITKNKEFFDVILKRSYKYSSIWKIIKYYINKNNTNTDIIWVDYYY